MKDFLKRFAVVVAAGMFSLSALTLLLPSSTYAEDNQDTEEDTRELVDGTSISISPVSKVLQLDPNSTYDDILKVSNDSKEPVTFEVYAAPYSYVYSEENDSYSLGFSSENSYTQITRWISIKDTNGNYAKKPTFTAAPGESVEVSYRIKTPDSIPAGGQYAVLFAHTLSSTVDTNGLKTEASPGMVIYGRTTSGETIITSEINNIVINRTITKNVSTDEDGQDVQKSTILNHINASAKIKNTGNLDFNARGILKVEGIFGAVHYETPENKAIVSIIPEAELMVSDEWEDTPDFGIYKVTWTVIAGNETKVEEMMVFLISPSAIIITIILLTIIIVGIIMFIRKRKERRSRLAV